MKNINETVDNNNIIKTQCEDCRNIQTVEYTQDIDIFCRYCDGILKQFNEQEEAK